YSQTKGILEGERKLVVKTNQVAAARRADYDSFRNATQSDQDQLLSCTIVAPAGYSGHTAASRMEGKPAELHKAGLKALQNKDYPAAIDLLKRAVDADAKLANPSLPNPTIKDGWYDL